MKPEDRIKPSTKLNSYVMRIANTFDNLEYPIETNYFESEGDKLVAEVQALEAALEAARDKECIAVYMSHHVSVIPEALDKMWHIGETLYQEKIGVK